MTTQSGFLNTNFMIQRKENRTQRTYKTFPGVSLCFCSFVYYLFLERDVCVYNSVADCSYPCLPTSQLTYNLAFDSLPLEINQSSIVHDMKIFQLSNLKNIFNKVLIEVNATD